MDIDSFIKIYGESKFVSKGMHTVIPECNTCMLFTVHGKSYLVAEGELLESNKQFIDGAALTIE